jgi:predicted RNA binding protein YcfA (HicA-like mRNA interferase family)
MKIPRNLSGKQFIKKLEKYGYFPTRQVGSHVRLTTYENGEHHVTVPEHDELRVGTLNGILNRVGEHLGKTKEEIIQELFN